MIKKILGKIIKLKDKIIRIIKSLNKDNAIRLFRDIKEWTVRVVSFVFLLTAYLMTKALTSILNWKFCPKKISNFLLPRIEKAYFSIVRLSTLNDTTINRVNLIEISLKNMRAKMTRTIITIGGMSIGIAAIVFLVSIGYGLQELVTARVARLEEMRQAEVSTQPGSNVRITDEAIKRFKEISEVDYALPVIALVGKVNYKNSVTDMAVYGVTKEYLNQSAVKPIKGSIFDSDEISYTKIFPMSKGDVAGVSTINVSYGDKIGDVQFSIAAEQWVPVKEKPEDNSKLLGYTKRSEGQQTGVEVWGSSYSGSSNGRYMRDSEGNYYGKWVKSKVNLWNLQDRVFKIVGNGYGGQSQVEGYIPETNISVNGTNIIEASVLGIATDTTESTESATEEQVTVLEDGWVYIEGEVENADNTKVVKVPLAANAKRKAVVNKAVLNVLGINENDAVGTTFQVSFILTSSLISSESEKVESEPADYEIVGVIPSDNTPLFYVPFIDLKTLGITNYSQVKVGVKKENTLADVRKKIEASGYVTTSVADTVAQIDVLFGTIRKVLALVGIVALAVASLGMFNTLTVSLLERTREIGLMKSMGMRSKEVEELFLSESMVMGFFGGLLGLIGGVVAGKLLGFILSMFAMFKGVGFIDISSVPVAFSILIISLSLFVGLITGIYPAKRATKISALNALRYE